MTKSTDSWSADRVKIVRLERASKDAKLYATRRARLSVLSSDAKPVVTCSARKPVAPTSRRDRNLVVSDVTDVHTDDTDVRKLKTPRFECAYSRGANRNSFVSRWISARSGAMSFCSKILPINFDHYFLIFPDTSKRGQWDNPWNPRDDVTRRYLLFVGQF